MNEHFSAIRRKYSTADTRTFRAMTTKWLNSMESIDVKSLDIIMYDRRLRGLYKVYLQDDGDYHLTKRLRNGATIKRWKVKRKQWNTES
jgi:hypothetical protein